jgi:hypothetical protein
MMVRVLKGGTDMWCPECEEIATCKAIPAAHITLDPEDYAQRWFRHDHPDICWFQRGRRCLACGHDFVTAEVSAEFLEELVELRGALSELKQHAEKFQGQSKAAAASLKQLTRSLGVLKALRVYQDA